jgi:phosphoesterase RecJ-like protein
MTQEILNKIKEFDTIIIHRHVRPDGDCMGSQMGLLHILKASFPEKKVYAVGGDDVPEYLKGFSVVDAIKDELYADALVIVVDTSNSKRIQNDNWKKAKFTIKIDHHDDSEDFADINYVDEKSPSCSAMIARFYNDFDIDLKLPYEAAYALYFGIVTDTGRFRYRGVNGAVLRNASVLLDKEIDLEKLYSSLYLKNKEFIKFQGFVYRNFKMTKNGVVYIRFTRRIQKKFNVTPEEAGNMVNTIDSIKGSLIWIAFIDQPNKEIRGRLRSRFLAINDIATKYRGGGHLQAAGATMHSNKEVKELLALADQKLKEFKEKNPELL